MPNGERHSREQVLPKIHQSLASRNPERNLRRTMVEFAGEAGSTPEHFLILARTVLERAFIDPDEAKQRRYRNIIKNAPMLNNSFVDPFISIDVIQGQSAKGIPSRDHFASASTLLIKMFEFLEANQRFLRDIPAERILQTEEDLKVIRAILAGVVLHVREAKRIAKLQQEISVLEQGENMLQIKRLHDIFFSATTINPFFNRVSTKAREYKNTADANRKAMTVSLNEAFVNRGLEPDAFVEKAYAYAAENPKYPMNPQNFKDLAGGRLFIAVRNGIANINTQKDPASESIVALWFEAVAANPQGRAKEFLHEKVWHLHQYIRSSLLLFPELPVKEQTQFKETLKALENLLGSERLAYAISSIISLPFRAQMDGSKGKERLKVNSQWFVAADSLYAEREGIEHAQILSYFAFFHTNQAVTSTLDSIFGENSPVIAAYSTQTQNRLQESPFQVIPPFYATDAESLALISDNVADGLIADIQTNRSNWEKKITAASSILQQDPAYFSTDSKYLVMLPSTSQQVTHIEAVSARFYGSKDSWQAVVELLPVENKPPVCVYLTSGGQVELLVPQGEAQLEESILFRYIASTTAALLLQSRATLQQQKQIITEEISSSVPTQSLETFPERGDYTPIKTRYFDVEVDGQGAEALKPIASTKSLREIGTPGRRHRKEHTVYPQELRIPHTQVAIAFIKQVQLSDLPGLYRRKQRGEVLDSTDAQRLAEALDLWKTYYDQTRWRGTDAKHTPHVSDVMKDPFTGADVPFYAVPREQHQRGGGIKKKKTTKTLPNSLSALGDFA